MGRPRKFKKRSPVNAKEEMTRSMIEWLQLKTLQKGHAPFIQDVRRVWGNYIHRWAVDKGYLELIKPWPRHELYVCVTTTRKGEKLVGKL